MFTLKRLIGGGLFVFVLAGTALTQEKRAPIETPREPVPAIAPLVTAAATAKRVRFVSPGSVVQLRLEVYNDAGQKLFDTELRGGNVLDWHLQDGAGERLAAGSYACVLTIKSLSGRLSQRVGLVTVGDTKAAVEAVGARQLSQSQQQTIGPVEGNVAFTVLQESEAEAITAITHDGQDGQVTSTKGALTFRTGDVFAGKDKEHLRITEDGRVGVGTEKPEATLDVAGTVRVSEGIKFSDGTTLDASGGKLKVRDAAGELGPSAAGTGNINRLAKWQETGGAGTLTDAAGAEVSGLTLFGQNSSGQVAPFFPTAPTFHVLEVGATGSKSPLTLAGGAGVMEFWKDLGGGTGAPVAAVAFGMAKPGTVSTNDMVFSTYSSGQPWNERMRLTNAGDVGIGTNNPQSKLDVAGNINTSTQYNIGGSRVLSAPGVNNTFAGLGAGATNMGSNNSFFGTNAGLNNMSNLNSFFGSGAGRDNNTGIANSFFGSFAGFRNNTGSNNSFFGKDVGGSNQGGSQNAFFGWSAGQANSTGSNNSFFGQQSGFSNSTGSGNVSIGAASGTSNFDQNNNTFIGSEADGAPSITNATAIGYRAQVTQSNSLVLGSINGTPNGATADTKVGIGTTAPAYKLHVIDASNVGLRVQTNTAGGTVASFGGNGVFYVDSLSAVGGRLTILENGNLGIKVNNPVHALEVAGDIVFRDLGSAGIIPLCQNVALQISNCSSSIRYKQNINPFVSGLSLIRQLRPVSFNWRANNQADLGLVAEEVAAVEPLMTTTNAKGEIEGVKYDQLSVVLINAVREQQAQIERQQSQIGEQREQLQQKHLRTEQLEVRLAALEGVIKQIGPRFNKRGDARNRQHAAGLRSRQKESRTIRL